MCGIFGIVTRQGELSRDILARAQRSLAHRGPDDCGTIVLDSGSGGQVGFAHTRLSIIELSALGHQPMNDLATGNWIVFNGEIYNFRELRKQLESAGAAFTSQSDTETLLAAYRVWGDAFLDRLRGMFAFALWDAPRQRLLLARDPMGIKPLYYHQSGSAFIFASEIRALLQTGLVTRQLDRDGVLSYLAFGSVYEPRTIIEGIAPLAPGHVAVLENGVLQSREFWNPLKTLTAADENGNDANRAATKRLPETLRRAVLSHLVSDVPVGVFLSGGIDSSSLVAILSHAGVRASTFSLVFREKEFDEGQYSRMAAQLFGTDHHEILVSQEDALAILPDALQALDQPTIDGINTFLVSARTRAAGVKVALTGLGADEMFAGYSNFRRVPAMEKLSARLAKVPAVARRHAAASVRVIAGKSDRNRRFAEFAGGEDLTVHPYFLTRTLFSRAERCELFEEDVESSECALKETLQTSVTAARALDPVNRMSYLESRCYMTNTLLRDSDFMSMAHGLELRVPFLDRDLVETCFHIPGKKKLGGDLPKNMLLQSLGVELPVELAKRQKRGFTLPFERWLRGEMRGTVEAALTHGEAGRAMIKPEGAQSAWRRFLAGETSWSRPWSLFVLERWCEQNL